MRLLRFVLVPSSEPWVTALRGWHVMSKDRSSKRKKARGRPAKKSTAAKTPEHQHDQPTNRPIEDSPLSALSKSEQDRLRKLSLQSLIDGLTDRQQQERGRLINKLADACDAAQLKNPKKIASLIRAAADQRKINQKCVEMGGSREEQPEAAEKARRSDVANYHRLIPKLIATTEKNLASLAGPAEHSVTEERAIVLKKMERPLRRLLDGLTYDRKADVAHDLLSVFAEMGDANLVGSMFGENNRDVLVKGWAVEDEATGQFVGILKDLQAIQERAGDDEGKRNPPPEGYYTVAAVREMTGFGSTTVAKYAKMANVVTPGRGQRNFRYSLKDVRAILEVIIDRTSEKKVSTQCRAALQDLP